jgi:hypothetical protein
LRAEQIIERRFCNLIECFQIFSRFPEQPLEVTGANYRTPVTVTLDQRIDITAADSSASMQILKRFDGQLDE